MFTRLLFLAVLSTHATASPDPTQCPKKLAEQASPAPASPRVIKILLVDDEAMVRDTTARLLGMSGFEVTQTSSAREALAKLDGHDILLTDHNMPGLTGVELAQKVRELRPSLPIAIYSGKADAVKDRLEELGVTVDAIIEKPFQIAALVATLRGLVKD